MASFSVVGTIDNVKFLPNRGGCFMFVSEFKKGFRRKDGTFEEDKYLLWKIIFKQGLVKYISEHFNNGMLVEVKGEVLPYEVSHGTRMDGYSVLGQTCNLFSIPRANAKAEQRMMRDSLANSDEAPNLEDFQSPDF